MAGGGSGGGISGWEGSTEAEVVQRAQDGAGLAEAASAPPGPDNLTWGNLGFCQLYNWQRSEYAIGQG